MSKPISIFAVRSKALVLLWILLLCMFHVCLCNVVLTVSLVLQPCGHLLGSLVCCVFLCLWCSGSGVVLDCIDS